MMLLSATFTFLISNAVVTLASSKRGLGYAPGSTLPADLALFSSKQSVVSWLYNCTSLPLLLPSFAVHPHTHTCFLSPYIDASRFPALYVYVSSQGGRTPPATTGFGYLDFTVMQWSDVNIDSLAATLLQQGRTEVLAFNGPCQSLSRYSWSDFCFCSLADLCVLLILFYVHLCSYLTSHRT
jgi:hypothetical protein